MKTVLKVAGALLLLALAYVVVALARGTWTDWQPRGVTEVEADVPAGAPATIADSVLTFLTWNVGYGGLGAEADFFLDGGAFFFSRGLRVHMPEEDVARYTAAIESQLGATQADFFLLQEVDSLSDRSYRDLQSARFRKTRPTYAAAYAPNYINERVPVPVFEPWRVYGEVYSGLQSLSKYAPTQAQRHTLPGDFPWPDRVFQLDRCLLVNRYALAGGRELVVVNLHLSAYDDGSVKAQQLKYLAGFLEAEAAAGHLVVAGGDWNLMPPNFPFDHYVADPERRFANDAVPQGYPNDDWTFVYDMDTPTNRKINAPYHRDSSFVTTIDYFLLSPGLRARRAKVLDLDFRSSDHQPVYVEVEVL